MKLRTHYLIARIAAESADFSLSESIAFYIGTLMPDLSPMQFIHPHFYEQSGVYVFDKLENLSYSQSSFTFWEYGKMAHYFSDFCCSVHFNGHVGNVRKHVKYERVLNRYIKNNYQLLKNEYANEKKTKNLNSILGNYYYCEKYNPHLDLISAINACAAICNMAKRTSYHPQNAISLLNE